MERRVRKVYFLFPIPYPLANVLALSTLQNTINFEKWKNPKNLLDNNI